jgi:hypothetical protein
MGSLAVTAVAAEASNVVPTNRAPGIGLRCSDMLQQPACENGLDAKKGQKSSLRPTERSIL